MSERNYYVICDDNCKFPAMTAEQVIAAIAEATGNVPEHVDDAFITKILESNHDANLTFWKGTQAEFNALGVTAPVYQIGIGSDGKVYFTPYNVETFGGIPDEAGAVHFSHLAADVNSSAYEQNDGIADADNIHYFDASAIGERKTTWSNIKSKLKAYFDTVYPVNNKTTQNTLSDDDAFPFYDDSASIERKTTWANIKAKLKSYFDGLYSATGHTHTLTNITDVTATKAEVNRLSGVTSNVQTQLNGKAASSHTHAISDVTNLQTTLNGKIAASDKGAANGVATLDADGKVTAEQAQSSVVNVSSNRTLSLADAGKFLRCTGSSGFTITIPAQANVAFPVGTEIEIYRGAGAITLQAASGVTLGSPYITVSAGNSCVISERYAVVSLKMHTADRWVVSGMVE